MPHEANKSYVSEEREDWWRRISPQWRQIEISAQSLKAARLYIIDRTSSHRPHLTSERGFSTGDSWTTTLAVILDVIFVQQRLGACRYDLKQVTGFPNCGSTQIAEKLSSILPLLISVSAKVPCLLSRSVKVACLPIISMPYRFALVCRGPRQYRKPWRSASLNTRSRKYS